jgi:hypothetical protein
MGTKAFVLENKNGQTVRVLKVQDDKLYVIYRLDTRRVEFVDDVKFLDDNDIPYKTLHEGTVAEMKSKPTEIGDVGTLVYVSEIPDYPSEVEVVEDDDKAYPVILKWTSVATVAGLGFIFLLSFIIARYFNKPEEPVVVQVFEQQQQLPKPPEKAKTVEMAQKHITPTKKIAHMTKTAVKKKVVVTSNNHGKVKGRPGQNLNQIGALGALGGMGKNFNGSGGLNLNATKNNPGIAYGGMAAAGGLDKGLIGKGMISSGIGHGGNPQGFGGYGTKGRGGGRPGYGNMSMAGSSSGYFEPLGEEELVEGGLDRDQINAVIQRHIGQIIYCYEQGLQTKPSLSGRVSVKFVIGTSGAVNTAQMSNTSLGSSAVESCILGKLRGWQFPKPVGHVNVRVTYPFVLKRLSQG